MQYRPAMLYYIDPFGCAKNQVDAEIIMARLNQAGWASIDDPHKADLIIVNSCAFIETAKQESINAVLTWKKQYPEKKILLAGCLSQRYRSELEENLSEADGFLGCTELDNSAEKAAELIGLSSPKLPKARGPGLRPLLGFPGSAYIKISEGCSNNCSYCAIPLIRGPLQCRSIPNIIEECKKLLNRDIKELCLIGQDLASYNNNDKGLADLLKAIAALPGNFWLRLLYLHPDHFPLDILDIIAGDKRFLPYFDIPFQHASPRLLSLMGRNGNAESYLHLLDTIRAGLPDAVIRSTFLVGFPSESEEDFIKLLDFQEKARFDWLGIFTFSREEGTAAYSMKGRISKKIAQLRKTLMEQNQIPITEENMNRFIGRTMDVLVEEAIDDLWLGRVFCQAPEVDGAAVIQTEKQAGNIDKAPKPGDMIRGTVVGRAGFDLEITV